MLLAPLAVVPSACSSGSSAGEGASSSSPRSRSHSSPSVHWPSAAAPCTSTALRRRRRADRLLRSRALARGHEGWHGRSCRRRCARPRARHPGRIPGIRTLHAARAVVAGLLVCGSRAILSVCCARGVPAARVDGLAATYAGHRRRTWAVVTWLVVTVLCVEALDWAAGRGGSGLVVAGAGAARRSRADVPLCEAVRWRHGRRIRRRDRGHPGGDARAASWTSSREAAALRLVRSRRRTLRAAQRLDIESATARPTVSLALRPPPTTSRRSSCCAMAMSLSRAAACGRSMPRAAR